MKRRDVIRLIPLTLAGAAGIAQKAFSQDLRYDYPAVDNYKKSFLPPSEPLSLRYTKKIRDMLVWIRETQSENLLEA